MSIAISMVNLSITEGVILRCKDKGLNISEMCEDYLKQILLTFEIATDPLKCKHSWTWPFCTPFGLGKECIKCRTIKQIKIEGSNKDVWTNKLPPSNYVKKRLNDRSRN